jgi:hypothetical protein
MKTSTFRDELFSKWLGIFLILEAGLIHLLLSQQHYEESPLLGYLFAANFFGALLAAYGIYREQVWGWGLGAFIAAGSIAAYILDRTVGIPGVLRAEKEAWFSPVGVMSLVLEGLFLLVAALVVYQNWRANSKDYQTSLKPVSMKWLSFSMPVVTIFAITAVSLLAVRWEKTSGHADHGYFESTEEVKHLPLITSAELEERYGIRISRIAISALDSIVDIRLQVFDPEKAHELLDEKTALLVDDQSLVLSPHRHGHDSIKPGQIYVIFFPTMNRTVMSGSQVSLVFNDFRVEAVSAR